MKTFFLGWVILSAIRATSAQGSLTYQTTLGVGRPRLGWDGIQSVRGSSEWRSALWTARGMPPLFLRAAFGLVAHL